MARRRLRPPGPRPGDADLDYRFTLANERTFLSWRWLDVEKAMREQRPIPPSWLPSLVAATVGILSLSAAVLLAYGQLRP